MRVSLLACVAFLPLAASNTCTQTDGGFIGAACGYNCDDNCNCGHCNSKPGCMSEDTCLGNCNSGNNAKWCPDVAPSPPPAPTPTPTPSPAPTPSVDHVCNDGSAATPIEACGYNCDENCNCGRCNSKPGCMSKDTCEGACNSGGNAKWCGKAGPSPAPTPTPPPAPTPPPSPAPTPSVDHVCNDGSSATPIEACGYNCDDNCNCGRCNSKPGCMSKDTCEGACNDGGNAKWCGKAGPSPAPTPTPTPPPAPTPPPSPAPTPSVDHVCNDGSTATPVEGCGYNCDDNCNCGRCNTKPGCMSVDTCLGTCNAGGNAKWCGKAPPPPTPAPPLPPPTPPSTWSVSGAKLQRNGNDVVLHGLGTTCTEYLVRGMGMTCFAKYHWSTPASVFSLDTDQIYPIIDYLLQITDKTVVPAVRIPLTASSWLGVNTSASSGNLAKYPELHKQYQGLISDMVDLYSSYGIVTILDLHWTDDDTDNGPMAGKGATNCVDFWDSVASTFASSTMVFYELYNEPHRVDIDAWMNGNDETSGMLEMLAAVRKHTTAPAIIAGYGGYAYDSDSLVQLDKQLHADENVIYNFHPYMGPHQAGDNKKCPTNFETYLTAALATGKPAIITEFGQGCNPTHGASEQCDGVYDGKLMGYDETIVTIADKHGVSWLPWAWRGPAKGYNTKTCQDINGGDDLGHSLASPTDGNGADFADIWERFGNKGLPTSVLV